MSAAILRSLRRFFAAAPATGPGDGDLLQRFVELRDEAAFELLVWRHAGLVVSVCRSVLHDECATEDAFQATFLILLRKAGSIRHTESLASWLHRVALRVALRARRRVTPRTGVDLEGFVDTSMSPGVDPDVRLALHEEVGRLPAKYRLPVVCCYLQARTHEEAAVELGWPKGTVAGRLARAKELLHRRLLRRGVSLGVGGIAAELTAGAATAAAWSRRVEGLLVGLRALVTGGPASAGVVSPGALALAEGAMTAMMWTKLKWAACVVVFLATAGLTAARWPMAEPARGASGSLAAEQGAKEPSQPAAAREEKPEARLEEAERRALTRSRLKHLALAMHGYHDVYGQFPMPALGDAKGKPLLSWRVALLPYLNQGELYKEFKLNEAWDSPHNKKLLAKMPSVYAPVVGKPGQPNSTYYQLLVGPGAIFSQMSADPPGRGGVPGMGAPVGGPSRPGMGEGPGMGAPAGGTGGGPPGTPVAGAGMGEGVPGMMGAPAMGMGMGMGIGSPRMQNITDGTSNTILIVEGADVVPWTKPEDVAFDVRKALPALGGQFDHQIHLAMADGSVRSIPKPFHPHLMRAAITANGGEAVNLDSMGLPAPVSPARKAALERLQKRNAELKEDAGIVREILGELRAEMENLRWAINQEKLLALDPQLAQLGRENAELEKAIREAKEEARKMLDEVRKLKEEMRKRPEK